MRPRFRAGCSVVLAVSFLSFAGGPWSGFAAGHARATKSQPLVGDLALVSFERSVQAYAALHRRLEGPLPTVEVSDDPLEVQTAMVALARDLRRARPAARRGDIFTAPIARVLRARIATCMDRGTLVDVLAEIDEDTPARIPALRVNGPFPAGAPFGFVPPTLLQALPELPPELQYRILRRSLVLWDYHADLVVDFIPDAFAALAT